MPLTLRATGQAGMASDRGNWAKVFQYEVQGLPDGEQALIAEINHRWRILRTIDGATGNWAGDYATPEEALTALQLQLSAP